MNTTSHTQSLQGDLTASSVPEVYASFIQSSLDDWPSAVDLAGVQRADSSALALLLALKNRASQAQKTLNVVNPPSALVTLADLSGISELLGWPTINDTAKNTNRSTP